MKSPISAVIILSVLTTTAFANYISPINNSTGKFYISAFGGYSSSNKIKVSQYGTAFFPEAAGGPLAVNAFGQLNSKSTPFGGIQLGYQAPEILLDSSMQLSLGPGAELEGFTLSNNTFTGNLSNNTTRLPEHTFMNSYPMSRNVFLANAVVNFSTPSIPVHPYIGVGLGGAIVRISGANATQVAPVEIGVNHYNSNVSDTNSTFAGQVKLGLSYDINKYVSVFAEYRRLYLANTQFIFGSTVYPTHAATSSWEVNLDPQRYNMGDLGVRINL